MMGSETEVWNGGGGSSNQQEYLVAMRLPVAQVLLMRLKVGVDGHDALHRTVRGRQGR